MVVSRCVALSSVAGLCAVLASAGSGPIAQADITLNPAAPSSLDKSLFPDPAPAPRTSPAMTPEEIAAWEATPMAAAKKDGKLVLAQLAARAVANPIAALDGEFTNYYTYRGMKVAMAFRGDSFGVRLAPGRTEVDAVAAGAKAGLQVTGAQTIGAGYVLLTIANPAADIAGVAAIVRQLSLAPELAYAAPCFFSPLDSELWSFPAQEIIIRGDGLIMPSGQAAAGLSPVAMKTVDAVFAGLEATSRMEVLSRNGFDVLRAANALASMRDAGVVYAEPDFVQQIRQAAVPNDPGFASQWHHRNTGQVAGWLSGLDMQSVTAWDVAIGSGVTVAINDTGVEAGHPDINQAAGRDFTDGSAGGFGDGSAQFFCEQHGTPCAGIVASTWNNGVDSAGLAPGSSTRSVRWGTQNQGVNCSNSFAGAGAWLANGLAWSLGQGSRVSGNSFSAGNPGQFLEDRYVANFNAGMLSFCSTGNNGAGSINYPASAAGTVAVGALDPTGSISSFSNQGTGIDMVGPGTQVFTADRVNGGYSGGNTTQFSGTSAAAPGAAGVAAVLVSGRPAATSAEILTAMTTTARDLGAAGYDTTFGAGLPQAAAALAPLRSSDDCANAVVVAGLPATVLGNTSQATISPGEPGSGCITVTSQSVWYKFTTGGSYSTVSANTFGSNFDSVLSIHPSCSGASIACNDDSGGLQSSLSFSATPNTEYYVRVASWASRAGGNLTLNLSAVDVAPPFDDCATPAVISTLPFSGSAVTTLATLSEGEPSAGCVFTTGRSVWYTYTTGPEYTTITADTTGSNFDTVLSVHSSCTGASIACDDDSGPGTQSLLSFNAVPNTSYLFRVSSYNTSAGGNMNLSVSSVVRAPDNDAQASAFPINGAVASTTSGITVGSTFEPFDGFACGGSGSSGDVWYTLTAPACDLRYTISTLDGIPGFYDTVLGVFTGTPGALTSIACNDDCPGAGSLRSCLTFDATANTTYYIRVAGFNGRQGQFDLVVVPSANLGNECDFAIELTSGVPEPLRLSCWTDSAISLPIGCGFGTIYKDGWYSFTPSVESNIEVNTFGANFDTVLAVYAGCPAADTTPITCNDDFIGLQSRIDFLAAAGTTYYIRAGGYVPSSFGDGPVLLTATPTAPPCLADVNGDGTVDGSDFILFINSFAIGDAAVDPIADIVDGGGVPPGDGTIDGSDFIAFINAFSAGC